MILSGEELSSSLIQTCHLSRPVEYFNVPEERTIVIVCMQVSYVVFTSSFCLTEKHHQYQFIATV